MLLKETFLEKNSDKKINILQLFRQYKRGILVSVSSVVVLIVISFIFGENGGEDIVVPSSDNDSIEKSQKPANNSGEIQEYDFSEAIDHIGEKARIKGKVTRVFTAKSGVTFLDFCEDWSDCPFSAVIFASDQKKFSDISKYEREVTITGLIKSYNGKAEIIIKSPEQIE